MKKIGIIGDFHNSMTQSAIADSLDHSNKLLGYNTEYQWIETELLDNNNYVELLGSFDGIWSASGSPFKSLNGSLNAIQYAREHMIPHIGTCGGFQHTIIEFARNKLGYIKAQHAEYSNDTENLFVDKLTCSLVGTKGIVKLAENTHTLNIFGKPEIEVEYFCNYGLNEVYQSQVLQDDLMIAGLDINNSVRVLELKNHPFFIITAFVPQVDSSFERPNRLVNEFVRVVNYK